MILVTLSADPGDETGEAGDVTCLVLNARYEGGALEGEESGNVESMQDGAPRITGFLGRGSLVTVSARTGIDLKGYVCDQNESGLLLETRDPSGDPSGYEFLPWSSIERVSAGRQTEH
jgi:hypothetical protein